MSVFSPLDPRGPDQRRKQLVQKLAQQANAARGAVGRIPMPGRMGPSMGEGRAFHSATDMRVGGKSQVTQAPNILQSVLAKLGVLGHSHAEEVSQGHGLPIAPTAPSQGMPIPPVGSAIPTPQQLPPPPMGGLSNTSPESLQPSPSFEATAPGQSVPEGVGQITTPGGHGLVDPGFLISDSGPVPLGNGLFYDPKTGTILGTQDAGTTGSSVRALTGHNTPV